MNTLKNYISEFIKRAGNYVFAATVISRILSFLASWIALQLIPSKPLGNVLFAWNFVVFLIPLVGFGLHQSYIRYGALSKNEEEKHKLLKYVVHKGTISSIVLTIIVSVLAYLYNFETSEVKFYLYILSLVFLPAFLFEVIKVRVRLEHKNKKLAYLEVVYNLILIVSVFVLSYYWNTRGYAISFVVTPLLTTLIFYRLLLTPRKNETKLEYINWEFWKYGIFGGLSNVVTLLLFALDIILIGSILNNPEMVTIYRYISLIPLSLLFLPRVFINTDFVAFTEKIKDVQYIKTYAKGYLTLFAVVSASICIFFYVFGTYILELFDPNFTSYSDSLMILTFGICGILILRGLYGNLLSSIGQVKMNFYITSVAIIINYFTNLSLIPELGIKGAAITSACLMWLTGLASAVAFYLLYKKYLLSLKES